MSGKTLNDAWEAYNEFVLGNTSKQEILTESGRWLNHIPAEFGRLPLAEINNFQIAKLRGTLESKQLSPQTIKHCLSLVHRIMRRAIEWGFYPGPMPVFRLPKFDNARMRYLTFDEAQLLAAELKRRSMLWHDISMFSLYTGLRAGEILALQAEHINLATAAVHVVDTKSSKNRSVPLNEAALSIADKYCAHKAVGYPLFQENGYIPVSTAKIFRKAVEACKLNAGMKDPRNNIVFHSLRHTFASWLVQKGTPLAVVSRLLGHSTLQMTMRYAHLAPEQGREAINTLPSVSAANTLQSVKGARNEALIIPFTPSARRVTV